MTTNYVKPICQEKSDFLVLYFDKNLYFNRELQTSLEGKVSEISELQEKIKDQDAENIKSTDALKLEKNNGQSMLESWDHKKMSLDVEIKERKG